MDLIIYSIPLITIVVSFYFYWRQNTKNTIGGKIALSKLFWLDYTLMTWFLLPLYFVFAGKRGGAFTIIYILSASMWIRGLVELFMLYISKNWTPPIGITHDIVTLLLVVSSFPFIVYENRIHTFFILSLMISLCLETYYALSFYKIVKDETKGEKAIWFVSKENPAFKKILKVTVVGNVFVYTSLILFLMTLN